MLSPTHPGDVLSDEISEMGISISELARQLDVPANRLSQIVRGQRSISGDTALRLGHWFGTSGQFWMNLQAKYDLLTAQDAAGTTIDKLPTRAA